MDHHQITAEGSSQVLKLQLRLWALSQQALRKDLAIEGGHHKGNIAVLAGESRVGAHHLQHQEINKLQICTGS